MRHVYTAVECGNKKTNKPKTLSGVEPRRERQREQAGICSLGGGPAMCPCITLTTVHDWQLLQEVASWAIEGRKGGVVTLYFQHFFDL